MRFLALVAAAAVTGAVFIVSMTTLFPQQHASVVTAMHAVGDRAARFQFTDLNPLRWAYDYVIGQATSPKAKIDFGSSLPLTVKMPTPLETNKWAIGDGLIMKNNATPQWHDTSRSATIRCSRGGITVPCD
jgi:hypothetical protein